MLPREKYLVDNLNWDNLRRNHAFKSGLVHLDVEFKESAKNLKRVKQGKSKKVDHRSFNDLPCILPVKLRS